MLIFFDLVENRNNPKTQEKPYAQDVNVNLITEKWQRHQWHGHGITYYMTSSLCFILLIRKISSKKQDAKTGHIQYDQQVENNIWGQETDKKKYCNVNI